MSEIAPNGARGITQFNPTLTKERLATAEAVAARAARLQDWPQLEAAVDYMIEEQTNFVAWWEDLISPRQSPGRGGVKSVADRRPISADDMLRLLDAWHIPRSGRTGIVGRAQPAQETVHA